MNAYDASSIVPRALSVDGQRVRVVEVAGYTAGQWGVVHWLDCQKRYKGAIGEAGTAVANI